MEVYLTNNSDPMWEKEAEKLRPWLYGKGADIGCGTRSAKKGSIRVDIDKNVKPEVLASGDSLPFNDGELDFISSIHSFEHFKDQNKLINEWLRVLKINGIIAIVHPDIRYTYQQSATVGNNSKGFNPLNTHYHENTESSLIDYLITNFNDRISIVDHGSACPNWSFYLIIKKIKE